jgi:transcriptional regulator with XRE-family HTH domain
MQQIGALYKEIGKLILRYRMATKPRMSQQRLADAIGLSRASIVNIERGRHRIQIHVLYDIAIALSIDPHALLPSSAAGGLGELLPADFRKELSEREILAVERMLTPTNGESDA